MASLSESHLQLETRGAELSMANAVLRQEVQERQRAEQALRERDEQLRQSQKMEAIGTPGGRRGPRLQQSADRDSRLRANC